jgi:EpsI family protein
MTKLFVAFSFLALNFYTYYHLATESVRPERRAFAEFPMELGEGWRCEAPQTMEEKVQRNLGVTDYLLCDFVNPDADEIANIYVGYHATQVREEGGGASENSIHPPAHCIPGSGWDIIHNESVPLHLEGMPQADGRVRRLVIAKGPARQLVYYWYQGRGRVVSQDWRKIVYVGLDRALTGRTDESLVRFTVPILDREGGEERAEAAFRSLAPLVTARLSEYVPN